MQGRGRRIEWPQSARFPVAVGFLGAGQMATALAAGWANAGLLDVTRSVAADPVPGARANFQLTTGVRAIESNLDVLAACDVLVLAVKPQVMRHGARGVESGGVGLRIWSFRLPPALRCSRSRDSIGDKARLVRVMPNTPCLVGASATGFAPAASATPDDAALVEKPVRRGGRGVPRAGTAAGCRDRA